MHFQFDAVVWDIAKVYAVYFGTVLLVIGIILSVLVITERKQATYRLSLSSSDYETSSHFRVLRTLVKSVITRSFK